MEPVDPLPLVPEIVEAPADRKTVVKKFLLVAWRRFVKIFIVLFVAQLVYILVLKWVNPPITVTQLTNWISGYGLSRDYVPWGEMSPQVRLAVMASEDQLFPYHNGFDWRSIQVVMKNSPKKKKRIRGASTISQQVAKNVFLWQGRSWVRKGMEAYFTFMIEGVWGKRRILEVYLNVAETGKGVFGVESASRKYFKKSAKRLSREEAAMIAAVLPNPKKYSIRPISNYVSVRSSWILTQMNNLDGDTEVKKLLK